jgi:hypothetical protein
MTVSKKERGFRKAGTFMFEPKQKFENHEKLCAAHVLTEGLDSCVLRVCSTYVRRRLRKYVFVFS